MGRIQPSDEEVPTLKIEPKKANEDGHSDARCLTQPVLFSDALEVSPVSGVPLTVATTPIAGLGCGRARENPCTRPGLGLSRIGATVHPSLIKACSPASARRELLRQQQFRNTGTDETSSVITATRGRRVQNFRSSVGSALVVAGTRLMAP